MFWAMHQVLSIAVILAFPIIFIGAVCLLEWIGEKHDIGKGLRKRMGLDDDTAGYLKRKGDR